jgi:DNA-directed RNA polymerase specialized sigma24 family protein
MPQDIDPAFRRICRRLYVDENKSIREIAEITDRAYSSVHKALEKENVPRRATGTHNRLTTDALQARAKEIIRLRDEDKLSFREIGRRLKMADSGVWKIYQEAKNPKPKPRVYRPMSVFIE